MNLLRPCLKLDSVFDINADDLVAKGINSLIIDLDETLIPKDMKKFSIDIIKWVEHFKSKGFKICITSNSIRSWRVNKFAGELDLPSTYLSLKPLPWAFKHALKVLKNKPEHTAMVGDQLFTDILGGNLNGIYTIMVKPMSPEKFLLRKLLRAIENFLLNRL